MDVSTGQSNTAKRGAADSGRYFRYMAEFIDFTAADAEAIRQTKPIIEQHIPEIVAKFYRHLLRYPPTRQFFLKKDGAIDEEYVELRMRHLTNFWLRTAGGVYDEDYASYVDYVGRAHTSRGADPNIYVAERYVIGQVGFIQHAIGEALGKELRHIDEDLEFHAVEAWDKLMMVILEMLSRAYGHEREAERYDALQPVDQADVDRLAEEAFETEHTPKGSILCKDVFVARVDDIPEGERKIVQIGELSIGVFHHQGEWYALRNKCLHRGGPVATGSLEGDTLTCPWHGFQYDVTTGQLLVDPKACLDTYAVSIIDGEVHLQIPDVQPVYAAPKVALQANEFHVGDIKPGQAELVKVDGEEVAVYNVAGRFFATQAECTHQGGPLSEGELEGNVITCPWHGSRFDVTTGQVVRGPAKQPIKVYRVSISGDVGRVEDIV